MSWGRGASDGGRSEPVARGPRRRACRMERGLPRPGRPMMRRFWSLSERTEPPTRRSWLATPAGKARRGCLIVWSGHQAGWAVQAGWAGETGGGDDLGLVERLGVDEGDGERFEALALALE